MTPTVRTLGLLLCGASAAVLVAGCRPGAQEASAADAPPPLAALPLADTAAPATRPGPVAVDLPSARPAPLGPLLDPGDGYAYLDRAYFLNEAFGEAPPDYGFEYADQEQPWVWRTDDGFTRIVEFLPYGVRYYYYEPGEDYPFLIRDPDYGYAYADGQLVAVYDSDDTLLPPEDLTLHAPVAGRELARAEGMFRGARSEAQPVAVAGWTAHRTQIASDLMRWRNLEGHQSAWHKYHGEHLKTEQAHWAPERYRRAGETARIDRRIHDPDGAEHALRTAREARDIARRAHVEIATGPRGRQGPGAASAQARMAMQVPAGRVMDPARTEFRGGPPGGAAGGHRMAMALGGPAGRGVPEPRDRGPGPGRSERGGPPAFQGQPGHLHTAQDAHGRGHDRGSIDQPVVRGGRDRQGFSFTREGGHGHGAGRPVVDLGSGGRGRGPGPDHSGFDFHDQGGGHGGGGHHGGGGELSFAAPGGGGGGGRHGDGGGHGGVGGPRARGDGSDNSPPGDGGHGDGGGRGGGHGHGH